MALVAYLPGRAALPLFLGRRAHPPESRLALELLLGNVLLSTIGLLLAQGGSFTLRRFIVLSAVAAAAALATRRFAARRAVARSYGLDDLMGLVIGPLFVMTEVFFMLGLKPKLKQYVEARVGPVVAKRVHQTA